MVRENGHPPNWRKETKRPPREMRDNETANELKTRKANQKTHDLTRNEKKIQRNSID